MDDKLRQWKEKFAQTRDRAAVAASDAAYTVGNQAQTLMSVGKLKMHLAELERQVNTELQKVGAMVYATHTGNPTESEELLAQLEVIDGLKAEIAAGKTQLHALQGGRICGCCGMPVKAGDVFCGECGQPL